MSDSKKLPIRQYYRADFRDSYKHFTPVGYKRLRQLMHQISNGDEQAASDFFELIQPWMKRIRLQVAKSIFEKTMLDSQGLEHAANDVFYLLLERLQGAGIKNWATFSQGFQKGLAYHLEHNSSYYIGKPNSRLANVQVTEPDYAEQSELKEDIDATLKNLSSRERYILIRRTTSDETNPEIGKRHGIGRESVRQIANSAKRKFTDHVTLDGPIEMWLYDNDPKMWKKMVFRRENTRMFKERRESQKPEDSNKQR